MQQVMTSCSFDHPAERIWAAMNCLKAEQLALDAIHHGLAGRAKLGRLASGDTCELELLLRKHDNVKTGAADYGSIIFDVPNTRLPVQSAWIELVLTEQKNQRNELTMIMRYQPKYGVLGRVISATVMKSVVRNMLCRVLLCFDERILSRPPARISATRTP